MSYRRAAFRLIILLVVLGAGPAHAQDTLYVDTDAPGANNGTSWTDAYTDLQTAINNASSSSELWVAEGVYKPDNEGDSFTITGAINGVEVYGGFTGTESTRSARNPEENKTVLSGDVSDDDAVTTSGVTPDTSAIATANSHTVVLLDGTSGGAITQTTLLDGVIITGGQADGSSLSETRGGGLFCNGDNSECSPTLANVVFAGNFSTSGGGALFNEGLGGTASPLITNAVFSNNGTDAAGGAIFNRGRQTSGTSSPTIVNAVFEKNDAGLGGAIYNKADAGTASPSITNGVFSQNTAANDGGAIYNNALNGGGSDPQITNVSFTDNTAQNGGAIVNFVGFAGGSASPTIRNVILWGNSATSSGDEVYNDGDSPTIANSIVQGSGGSGGNWDTGLGTDGGGNLDRDPLLEYVPRSKGDDRTFATDDDGLHVTPESPAIDAGDNTPFQAGNVAENVSTDLTGADRIQPVGGTVDIGAYEGGRDQERTIYVDPTASGEADGTSWADADTTLQDTSTIASGPFSYATGNDEVRIAEGVYTPQKADTSFTLTGGRDGLKVYGGYPNGGGDRDPAVHRTVLSGDVGGDDNDSDGDGVIEDVSAIQGTNSGPVLSLDGTTSSGSITGATRIDGVVVTAGQGSRGGGLYCQADASLSVVTPTKCSPTLARLVFSGNLATDDGGALYNNGLNGGISSPTIIGSLFLGNKAADDGGAVLNEDGADPMIANVVFARNRANDPSNTNNGGAIYNSGGSPTIINATFSNNQADASGGALYIAGSSNPTVTNSILWGNGSSEVGDIDPVDADKVTFAHSIVQGSGGSGSWNGGAFGTDGGGNLDQDPSFSGAASLAGDDEQLATTDDSLSLAPGSPGLDAGTNPALDTTGNGTRDITTDITGGKRVQDLEADGTATVNIGAYESIVPTGSTAFRGPVLSATGATVGGAVNAGGLATTVQFRVTPANAPEQDTVIAVKDSLKGAVQKTATVTARSLKPSTTYEVQIETTNEKGSDTGGPVTFETPAAPKLQVSDGAQTLSVAYTIPGTGDAVVKSKTVSAKRGGEEAANSQSLSLTTAENFTEGTQGELLLSATIPDSLITTRGVDYTAVVNGPIAGTEYSLLLAADGTGLHLPVFFETFSPDPALSTELFQEETYRMASIPAAVNPKTALREAYGPYKPAKWRVLRWTAAKETYREFPELDSTDLKAGKAFWVVTKKGTPFSLRGGKTVDASTPRRVEVQPGWSQVGTPFGFAVPWDTVRTGSGFAASELDGPYRRGPEGYQTDAALQPWRGYFVFNATAETDTLLIPPVDAEKKTASSRRLATAKSSGRYTVRVTARSKAGPSTAMLGLRAGAKAGRDRYDIAKPPSVRPTPQVSVVQTAEKRSVPHAKSIKPAGGNGQTWTLRLHRPERGASSASVRLDWSTSGSLPEGQSQYVLDLATEQRVTPGKSFSVERGKTRRLKVIVGTERYAQKNNEGIPLQGYDNELRGNYPNPFDKKTTLEYTIGEARAVTIEVYNMLGQRVRTLVDTRKPAGLHQATWHGRNRYGDRVGSGVYFYRIEAGDFTASKKMVLVR